MDTKVGDGPEGWNIPVGGNEFWEAEKRLQAKLKDDPELGSHVLAAMLDPSKAQLLVQRELAYELGNVIHEKLSDGHELKAFCRDLGNWLVINGEGLGEIWGSRIPYVHISIKLSPIEDLHSSVQVNNGSA